MTTYLTNASMLWKHPCRFNITYATNVSFDFMDSFTLENNVLTFTYSPFENILVGLYD